MKVATLQFAPKIGDVEGNVSNANLILHSGDMKDVNLLVGPELAFTGKDIFVFSFLFLFDTSLIPRRLIFV
jgi:predicted amidohydrolase